MFIKDELVNEIVVYNNKELLITGNYDEYIVFDLDGKEKTFNIRIAFTNGAIKFKNDEINKKIEQEIKSSEDKKQKEDEEKLRINKEIVEQQQLKRKELEEKIEKMRNTELVTFRFFFGEKLKYPPYEKLLKELNKL